MFYFGHKDVECNAFDPTSGPCRGHFAREVAANEETRVERRMRKKRNAIVVDTWDLSEEEEEDQEEETVVPTQTRDETPVHTPGKRRMSAADMSSPQAVLEHQSMMPMKKTKFLSVHLDKEEEEEEEEEKRGKEDVNTPRRRRLEEEFLKTIYEEVEKQNTKKNKKLKETQEERCCCYYHVIPVTSRECLIECSMVFGERAQADFEERLKNKKMKVYEVDETENRYEVKPLKPISTKTRWREILRPSVQVVGRGKRKECFVEEEDAGARRKLGTTTTTTTREEYTSTGRRREGEEYTLPTKVDDSAWKDLPEKYRKQYLIQVEMQKKKKKKKNMNRTGREEEEEEEEEEEAALTVERRSAPNVYRSDTIATKPYQTATNVHNLNPFMVKEKITHALDMQSKERVDGRLNAILHVIRVIRNDLKITRGRDESEDFSDWIRYDLANAFPGWRMKLCMAVNTNELIPA